MIIDKLKEFGASDEISSLMSVLAEAVASISGEISLTSREAAGSANVYGETQMALDLKAEAIMAESLSSCPFVAGMASEELDEFKDLRKEAGLNGEALFNVVHDPLDGSSLIDVNFALGTIIGIYPAGDSVSDLMEMSPKNQIGAAFAVYGPRTIFVLSVGKGVHEFILLNGDWVYSSELKLGADLKYFAPGNLRVAAEKPAYADLVSYYMQNSYTLRYSGGMVPDLYHILKKGGGIFLYPGGVKEPDGKLRLLYECGPMAYIFQQAGGLASNGAVDVLDIQIESLTKRCPIIVGSKKEVEFALKNLNFSS